jgi:NadR type nicotinamide-nucleotide adenylyltransferase
MPVDKRIKIVITGAESTGKSTLAEGLAKHFNGKVIPELARGYIENLDRNYTYEDLEVIAKMQIEAENDAASESLVFFDTWLIITKVWFDFVYGSHPEWLNQAISNSNIDLFLLCDTDIPWIADPVRENGGENREILQNTYKKEMAQYGFRYSLIKGEGEERIVNALKIIEAFLNEN